MEVEAGEVRGLRLAMAGLGNGGTSMSHDLSEAGKDGNEAKDSALELLEGALLLTVFPTE